MFQLAKMLLEEDLLLVCQAETNIIRGALEMTAKTVSDCMTKIDVCPGKVAIQWQCIPVGSFMVEEFWCFFPGCLHAGHGRYDERANIQLLCKRVIFCQ